MRSIEEHIMLIGPWGWLGWILFAGALLLYYRLWTSAGPTDLRNLREELARARRTIDELRRLELQLKNRNDELHTNLATIKGQNADLEQRVQLLKQANDLQGESIARMEKMQRELMERNDYLTGRVITLELRLGIDPATT